MAKELGVVYLALGRPYLAMALLSAESLVRHNPDMPFTIVTNIAHQPPDVKCFRNGFDSWIYVDADVESNRHLKTRILAYSEYEKVIFLDCDTIVMGNLSLARKILEYFDVCLRLNRYPQKRNGKGDVKVLGDLRVSDLPHWNSGVMLVRNNATGRKFFEKWNEKYVQICNKYDQVALVPAIFESDARILSLEDRWNATDPGFGRGRWRKETLVFHYATNICNKLFHKIIEYDEMIFSDPSCANQTRQFLEAKRKLKRSQMSLMRYLVINAMWRISSPAGFIEKSNPRALKNRL
ncbi:glycosyl transferase family 8 [Halomonas ventosae]|uniref:Glycosyl transferase family 8 n=1 Tax=Halomonas ventosae TaxID=229007 RepID=A0A4R6ZWJ7_9GAMM|nr:glycosyltransferase [Halomonas ventosae]TDR57283.1 glycosyl transferase family 8 [Halomonas ventosae]